MGYEKFSLREHFSQRLKGIFEGGTYTVYNGTECVAETSLKSKDAESRFKEEEVIVGGFVRP